LFKKRYSKLLLSGEQFWENRHKKIGYLEKPFIFALAKAKIMAP
jgi:hypothetical protein